MTTLPRHEVLRISAEAWRLADVACDNDPHEDWYAYRDAAFAALCRADLVAENETLRYEVDAIAGIKAERDDMAAELAALRAGGEGVATVKQSLKVHTSSEDYLRYKYGAYRGHFAWRELEEAYSQGRYDEEQAQGPWTWPEDGTVVNSECYHEWVHREKDQPWLVCEKCGVFLAQTGPRAGTVGIDE